MTTIDRGILEFCAKDFRRLKELRAIFPGGTLYRRAKRLIKIGWLERQGPLYRSTSTGLRNLSDNQEDGGINSSRCMRHWDSFRRRNIAGW